MNRPFIAPRLIVVALILIGLAVQIVIGLQSDPPFSSESDRIGLVIGVGLGLVLIPITWRAFRPGALQTAAFRDAQLGIGTLVSARPTGTSINDQPELELTFDVETGEGRTFRAATKEIVDVGTLPQMVPGATCGIRYLPDGRIGLDASATEEQLTEVLTAARLAQGKLTSRQVNVAKNGVRAQAVVMDCRPTGVIVDGDAVIHLDLKVTRPDGSTFDAEREMPLPAVALPGLQAGSVVEARYLPGDESYVAVQTRVR